jgi:hypothetical protein
MGVVGVIGVLVWLVCWRLSNVQANRPHNFQAELDKLASWGEEVASLHFTRLTCLSHGPHASHVAALAFGCVAPGSVARRVLHRWRVVSCTAGG